MAAKRPSYRNPFISALLYASLYLVIWTIFHWVFFGVFVFANLETFDWPEVAVGAIVMAVCVILLEFLRNVLGKKE